MSVTIKVNGVDVDLKNIIHEGTATVTNITGITGKTPTVDWEKCKPLGITINSVDIASSFTAKYIDYPSPANDVAIPTGVTQLKVVCIGGSGGGSGGNGGRSGYNLSSGNNKRPDGIYNVDRSPGNGPISNGNDGKYGNYGQYTSETFNRIANTFNIATGNRGVGGSGGTYDNTNTGVHNTDLSQKRCGGAGGNGNATTFKIGNQSLIANGGNGGTETTLMTLNNVNGPKTPPAFPFPLDRPVGEIMLPSGGAGGLNGGNGGNGVSGNPGFCRVYFLY